MKRSQIQRKTQLKQTKPINQRSKHNKYRNIKNDRLPEGTPCQMKLQGCTGYAIETNELKGGGYKRKSMRLNFKLHSCRHCHDVWHLVLTKEEKKPLRAMQQLVVMQEQGWSKEQFTKEFENYL